MHVVDFFEQTRLNTNSGLAFDHIKREELALLVSGFCEHLNVVFEFAHNTRNPAFPSCQALPV